MFFRNTPVFLVSLLTALVIFSSCCTQKNSKTPTNSIIIILLADNTEIEDIVKTYSESGLQSVKRSSKSQNEYTCRFLSDGDELKATLEALGSDERIISVYLDDYQLEKNKGSVNIKKNKTGPVK